MRIFSHLAPGFIILVDFHPFFGVPWHGHKAEVSSDTCPTLLESSVTPEKTAFLFPNPLKFRWFENLLKLLLQFQVVKAFRENLRDPDAALRAMQEALGKAAVQINQASI